MLYPFYETVTYTTYILVGIEFYYLISSIIRRTPMITHQYLVRLYILPM